MINNILLEHVGQPHILDLAVQLVNVILVSALGPNLFFSFFGGFIQLGALGVGGLLGQGLGLGPGLDNKL